MSRTKAEPTRRALLSGFAAASAVRVMGANDRIRLGLIGCGGISKADLNAFFASPEVDCVTICDVDDARIAGRLKHVEEARGRTPAAVKDYRRILDQQDIDVVLICTPDHWHALPMVHACQAGKDVYVEKPLATTIAEGRAMVAAARRHQRVVQMGTQWRSGEHYRRAIEYVHSGKLGKIRQVRVWAYLDWVKGAGNPLDAPVPAGVDYDMWLGPAPKRPFNKNRFHFNFRWFWDYAGGLMTDWGVHLINLALWGTGPEWPKRVFSSGGRYVLTDNTETPDSQIAVYDFPSYRLIFEHQIENRLGPDRREHGVWFNGTDASLILYRDAWEVIPEPSRKSVPEEIHKSTPGDQDRAVHARNFLDCVRSREDPVENVDIGHHVSSVAHLGNLAFRSTGPVEWDAKRERVVGNKTADKLVGVKYRKPWKLPYMSRG